jgi:hypothetical protein
MATLVYSDRCQYSAQVIKLIQENPALIKVMRFHNVTTNGIPDRQVTRVPTLLTNDGKILVGIEVKAWVDSMAPIQHVEANDSFGPATTSLDGTDSEVGNMFDLDKYGSSLAPTMTPELEQKISRKVQDAYSSMQNNF